MDTIKTAGAAVVVTIPSLLSWQKKNTLEAHFVAWKRQETVSGMTVGGDIEPKN